MNFNGVTLIVLAFLLLLLFAFIFSLSLSISSFSQSMKYINLEIKRSEGAERLRWKRKKRRLWMHAFFPFIK